jgi:hypothetical protein
MTLRKVVTGKINNLLIMKKNILLCAVALAAGLVSSRAQSNVYSLNVVGYVNVPTCGGGNFKLICNPLNNSNNNITNLFRNAQDGDSIFRWDSASQDLSSTIYSYSSFLNAWDGNYVLKPGEAIFYLNAGNDATNTFIGDVIQGPYTNPIPAPTIRGGGSFNAIGSSVPLGGSVTNAIVGILPQDGDSIFTWNCGLQDLDTIIASYSSFLHAWDNSNIQVPPGIGFFYLGAGANQTAWVRSFTVQ